MNFERVVNCWKDECATHFDKILYTIKHMHSLDEIPFIEREDDIYNRIDSLAQYANLSYEEKTLYDLELKRRRDRACELESAYYTGSQKGRAEGIMETACNLKNLGVDLQIIAKSTGLSEQTINEL